MASLAAPGIPGSGERQGPHVPLPTPSFSSLRAHPAEKITYHHLLPTARASHCLASNTGADDRDRTGDLVLTKDVLCQLSYIGLCRPAASADRSAAQTCITRSTRPSTPTSPPGTRVLPAAAPAVSPARCEGWSGRRGSNPRPTAWKAVTLPLSYSRLRRFGTATSCLTRRPPRALDSSTLSGRSRT
jgi:hypothetical protein